MLLTLHGVLSGLVAFTAFVLGEKYGGTLVGVAACSVAFAACLLDMLRRVKTGQL